VGRTLHNILAEALICTVEVMGLTVSYLPRGTCYQHCLASVSTAIVMLSGAEAVVIVSTVVEVLALRAYALVGEGFLLLTAALIGLLFLVRSVAAQSGIFLPSPGQVLLHEAQTLVLLPEAH
jgi:hypothetical protein